MLAGVQCGKFRCLQVFAARRRGWLQPAVPSGTLRRSFACRAQAAPVHDVVQWVRESGGRVCGVEPALLEGDNGSRGWGLRAIQELKAGETLVQLPRKCQLVCGDAVDARLAALQSKVPPDLRGAALALQLLQHRVMGDASSFAAYLHTLPRGVPGVPIFFSAAAVDALQYPPVIQQVKARGRWLAMFSSNEIAQLRGTAEDPFSGAAVDVNALGWALATVTSRAFKVGGPAGPQALLPLVDLANHALQPNAAVQPAQAGALALVATAKVEPGAEICIRYGSLGDDMLLLDYGFLLGNNPFTRVQLRFDTTLLQAGLSAARAPAGALGLLDKLPQWKRAQLRELRLLGDDADTLVELGGPQGACGRLLAATRVCLASSQQLLAGRSVAQLCDWERPLSASNEELVLSTLLGVCALTLARFPTALDVDETLLQQQQQQQQQALCRGVPSGNLLPEDTLAAVRFRAALKRVLVESVQQLATRLATARMAAPSVNGKHGAGKGFG